MQAQFSVQRDGLFVVKLIAENTDDAILIQQLHSRKLTRTDSQELGNTGRAILNLRSSKTIKYAPPDSPPLTFACPAQLSALLPANESRS